MKKVPLKIHDLTPQEREAFPGELYLSEEQKSAVKLLERSVAKRGCLRPDAYMPEHSYLDELLRGELSETGQFRIFAWFEWLDCTHAAMDFFQGICRLAMLDARKRSLNISREPAEAILRKLSDLATAVSAAYWEAQIGAQQSDFAPGREHEFPSVVELAKRYREYTAYAEKLVMKIWPGLNRALLFNPEEPDIAQHNRYAA